MEVASTILRRPGTAGDRCILLLLRQVTVKRDDVRIIGKASLQPRGRAGDFRLARQEGKDGTCFRRMGFDNRLGDFLFNRRSVPAILVADIDWKCPAEALNHWRGAHQRADAFHIEWRT